jgi:hypothetical protein
MFENQAQEPVIVHRLLKKEKFTRLPVPGDNPDKLPGVVYRRMAIDMQDLHGFL